MSNSNPITDYAQAMAAVRETDEEIAESIAFVFLSKRQLLKVLWRSIKYSLGYKVSKLRRRFSRES